MPGNEGTIAVKREGNALRLRSVYYVNIHVKFGLGPGSCARFPTSPRVHTHLVNLVVS
jgi:hypothetical protein